MRAGSVAALTIALLCPGAIVCAQTPVASASPQASVPPAWAFRASAAAYFFPDEDDYLQPTVTADRGALHLEGRYNYEDTKSASGFLGWTFEAGRSLTLEVTPMFGVVFGDTDGVVPAAELTFSFHRFEIYSESEYVFDLNNSSDDFFYSWSEFSLRPVDWLRAGVVVQRTRPFGDERDLQRGVLAGVEAGRLDGTVYFFNPGSSDRFFVASVGISF